MKLAWSCDEADRKHCRNPHGCHCAEITHLIVARDKLTAERERVTRNRDMWKGQCERQAEQLRQRTEKPTRGGPTEAHPDAPYCKPDQSCCDFCCGN